VAFSHVPIKASIRATAYAAPFLPEVLEESRNIFRIALNIGHNAQTRHELNLYISNSYNVLGYFGDSLLCTLSAPM
jgi:hypothetical protein